MQAAHILEHEIVIVLWVMLREGASMKGETFYCSFGVCLIINIIF